MSADRCAAAPEVAPRPERRAAAEHTAAAAVAEVGEPIVEAARAGIAAVGGAGVVAARAAAVRKRPVARPVEEPAAAPASARPAEEEAGAGPATPAEPV